MDYEKFSRELIELIGGEANVGALTHCVTRLRFTLADESKADTEAVKKLKGVLSVVQANNQYQVVMGGEVIPTYNAIVKMYGFGEEGPESPKDQGGEKKGNLLSGLMDYISGVMVQIIPLLIGAGLVSAALSVASIVFGVDTTTPTYLVFNTVARNTLYFMPAFVGFAAAKKLKCNPFIAAFIALFLLNPSFTAVVQNKEAAANLFGFLFPALSYSSTIFPMLIGTYVLSKLEPAVYGVLPKVLKSIFGPFLCIVVMVPLMLYVIGPVGYYIGYFIAQAVLTVQAYVGFLGCGILAAANMFLVLFGAHTVTAPVMTELLGSLGYDNLIRPALLAGCFATLGAVLAVAMKSKDKEYKGVVFGTAVAAFVGTTEPALYGVLLPLKRPMIGALAGSFAGGCVAALLGAKAFAMGKNGIFGLLVFAETTPAMLAGVAVAMAVGFAVTWLIGFKEK